jgi:hypothetical protein
MPSAKVHVLNFGSVFRIIGRKIWLARETEVEVLHRRDADDSRQIAGFFRCVMQVKEHRKVVGRE